MCVFWVSLGTGGRNRRRRRFRLFPTLAHKHVHSELAVPTVPRQAWPEDDSRHHTVTVMGFLSAAVLLLLLLILSVILDCYLAALSDRKEMSTAGH